MKFCSLGVLPLLKARNWFDQRCPCIVFECFQLFWTIKCFLEPFPLTHALQDTYHTLIYDQAFFTYVHMAIRDHLRWFGRSLVHLGEFEVQSKPATCMPSILLQMIMILSYCKIIIFRHVYTSICDLLRWFGRSLVHLGCFEVQSKPTTCMHPNCLQRLMIFSKCNINMFQAFTYQTVIIKYAIGSILMC